MRAAWTDPGSFDTAVWGKRMAGRAGRVDRVPPAVYAPPVTTVERTTLLQRACGLLRDRLNRLEAPPRPLTASQKRLLTHQTSRLSRIVERLLFGPAAQDSDRYAA